MGAYHGGTPGRFQCRLPECRALRRAPRWQAESERNFPRATRTITSLTAVGCRQQRQPVCQPVGRRAGELVSGTDADPSPIHSATTTSSSFSKLNGGQFRAQRCNTTSTKPTISSSCTACSARSMNILLRLAISDRCGSLSRQCDHGRRFQRPFRALHAHLGDQPLRTSLPLPSGTVSLPGKMGNPLAAQRFAMNDHNGGKGNFTYLGMYKNGGDYRYHRSRREEATAIRT